MEKEIYIIRHGETEFNHKGIVQGKGINSVLNQLGNIQASLFFEAYKNEGFEKIYVSELQRTYQTIQLFSQLNIPIEKHSGIDEISWGIHEGKANGDTFKQFYKILHLWKNGNDDVKIQGGESPAEVQQRINLFLETCLQEPNNKILICTHGRAMRILLCTLLKLPLSRMDTFPHRNVCLYKLHYKNEISTIVKFNNTMHFEKAI